MYFFFFFFAVRYLIIFVQFAMDCRKNPRLSWSCIWLLLTTAQEAQADVTDASSHKTSGMQAMAKGSDFDIPGIIAEVNDSCQVDNTVDNDEGVTASYNSLQHAESVTKEPPHSL